MEQRKIARRIVSPQSSVIRLYYTLCLKTSHTDILQITYTYSTSALLQKPITISAVIGGLFVLAMGLRRVDVGIEKEGESESEERKKRE